MSRAVIFANGEIVDTELIRDRLQPGDLVIAADGGLRHVLALEMSPHVVLGDLDSAPGELVELAEHRGAEIIRYPVDKDKSDLELALELAADRGSQETVIFGATGGRLDHALANILLLGSGSGQSVRIVDAESEVFVVHNEREIKGNPGDIVTLLPLSDAVTGITTRGLEYPLTDETLARGTSRGVSNVMLGPSATISVREGTLLTVHVFGHSYGG